MMGRAAKRVFIRHILETSLDLDGLAEEVKAVQPSFEVTNINKWQGVKIAFASYHPKGTRLTPSKITDILQGYRAILQCHSTITISWKRQRSMVYLPAKMRMTTHFSSSGIGKHWAMNCMECLSAGTKNFHRMTWAH